MAPLTREEHRQCLHALFEMQAAQTPDAVALSCEGKTISYRQLDRRANRLAYRLRALGVGPDVLVCVCLERSPALVEGLLGILKAGGAYVPLDPGYPRDRLAFMLEDSRAPVVLTQSALEDRLPRTGARLLCLDTDEEDPGTESDAPPPSGVASTHLAYVIYTSGSTGRPKGVMIEHRAIVNHMRWMQEAFPLTPADRVLQKTPVSFDASVWEFYAPLLVGGILVLARPGGHQDPAYLIRAMREQGVTILQCVPSLLRLLLEEPGFAQCDALRRVFCGGEALTPDLQQRFFQRHAADLINLYGPTEATIDATYWVCGRKETGPVPIGRPIANLEAYVVDGALAPVPVGVPGELLLGGVGLARGYWRRPELTAERFIPHPFTPASGARVYRTGDRVRSRPDGALEFLGRVDTQVKLRGYRIELGEIEAILGQHPDIRQAVATVREDRPGDQQLVAYYVGRPSQSTLGPDDLRQFVQGHLPAYMFPAAFVSLDAMPLLPNGKVDRQALPAPRTTERQGTYVPPRTQTEHLLANIWGEVLEIDSVGAEDNFFHLGGHSLKAAQVISRVRTARGVELPFPAFFEAATLADLARFLEEIGAETDPADHVRIHPATRDAPLPLSFSQERAWFIQHLAPDNVAYNFQAAIQINGLLDLSALERALAEMIHRHEILRTTFPEVDGRPIQVIHRPWAVDLPVVNLSGVSEAARDAVVQRTIQERVRQPFDLSHLPLLRWTLLRLSEREHVLIHVEHHIIHDGWSYNVFLGELWQLYAAFSQGKPSPLPEPVIQFADFAVWQRQWMEGKVARRQLDYWRRKLADAPPVLDLPSDRPRPAVRSFAGAAPRQELPAVLAEQLKQMARQEGVTLYMVMLAAYVVLLHRYTGQPDICVGSGIANRRWRETEDLIGMIINNIILRTDVSGDPTVREFLGRVREVTLEASANQDVPFDKVVEALQPSRNLGYNPLFQVMFGFHDAPMSRVRLSDVTASDLLVVSNGSAKFDLSLIVAAHSVQRLGTGGARGDGDGLTVVWEYSAELFDGETITRMQGHYRTLLEAMVSDPRQHLSDLSLLTPHERHHLLVEWNNTRRDYPRDRCLHHLFEEQARRTPQAVAVVFDGTHLTYEELDRRANHVAHRLLALGVGPDVRVGICVERSLELVIGLLGILKAGGAYVPLDPEYPPDRLALMLEDSQAPVVLTQERLRMALPSFRAARICLDSADMASPAACDAVPTSNLTPGHLAYVNYTSGSTGTPKGVMIPHRAIVNHMLWMLEAIPVGVTDRVLQKTPFSFDASLDELFSALLAGAVLVMARPSVHRDPSALAQALCQQQITTLVVVPSLLRALLETPEFAGCRSLRRVICGAEALPGDLQERFFQQLDADLYNFYGPTEAAVDAIWWKCRKGHSCVTVPIGRPIANMGTYILDEKLRPVPIGVHGELHVAGAGLARGYLNRPDLTAEKFIPNPFASDPGASLYRTGDVARYLSDGTVEFLGRLDHQVKVRGLRIELGEIETTLAQHPAVKEVVVVDRDHASGERFLVAYVVPGSAPPTKEDLRALLRAKLPGYMVPSTIVLLETLPLTPSGKVDRKALPHPEDVGRPDEAVYAPPTTATERRIAAVWQEVLRRERIGALDNFFDLGGHSLLATQIMSRLQRGMGAPLPLALLFEAPTLADLAGRIDHLLRVGRAEGARGDGSEDREEIEV